MQPLPFLLINYIPLSLCETHFNACSIFLGGGAANTEPATAAVIMPAPTKPEKSQNSISIELKIRCKVLCTGFLLHYNFAQRKWKRELVIKYELKTTFICLIEYIDKYINNNNNIRPAAKGS